MQIDRVSREDLLERYSATKALKTLGFVEKQLNQIRLSPKYRNEPIDDWPLLLGDTPFAQEKPPNSVLNLALEYARFRYALIEGPQAGGDQTSRAFELCSLCEIAPLLEEAKR